MYAQVAILSIHKPLLRLINYQPTVNSTSDIIAFSKGVCIICTLLYVDSNSRTKSEYGIPRDVYVILTMVTIVNVMEL